MCTLRNCALNRNPRLILLNSTSADIDALTVTHVFEFLVDEFHSLETEESKVAATIGPLCFAVLFGLGPGEGLVEGMREEAFGVSVEDEMDGDLLLLGRLVPIPCKH